MKIKKKTLTKRINRIGTSESLKRLDSSIKLMALARMIGLVPEVKLELSYITEQL